MSVTHFPGIGSVETARTACGKPHTVLMSADPELTTCQRCRATVRWQVAMSALTSSVDTSAETTRPSFVPTPEQAIEQQMRFTIRECLDYLLEGNRGAALERLYVGFNRQVRLAGLDIHLREGTAS